MGRWASLALGLALLVPGAARAGSATQWVGFYRLPASADPVAIAVTLHGATATVALGAGHSFAQDVHVERSGSRLRFSIPGLPAKVTFDGTRVTQGLLHGTVSLHPDATPAVSALGLYRSRSGAVVEIAQAKGLPTWLVELPSGAIHGLDPTLSTVGRTLGATSGDGKLSVARDALTWNGTRYARMRLRQWEVRVGGLAGTLTLPAHRSAAAVMVHGSEPNARDEFQVFGGYLASRGVGVLATDKRGAGQSTAPGVDGSSEGALRLLAADVRAQVTFLQRRGDVDAKRVGALGDSQAGWVVALAASSLGWAVPLVGPTTTVGETDLFTSLAGAEQRPPSSSRAAMLATVRKSGKSGFDPLPSLRRAHLPILWLYGDDDRNVPTELCVERLRTLAQGHDFTWRVLPMTHALIELPTGLYSSLGASRGFAPSLFTSVTPWLRAHGIAR